ncbi:MAG: type II toxin-antitoxin system RelE/ParE family toxin [Chloroflexi bacterium]|nr:type II toxin-antitoxin system RelE/ParE family toxin [Chloroflexota bacterium]
MDYEIRFKPRALKDGKKIPNQELARIFEKIGALENDLADDVKRLTNFHPEYRLRVGKYRVLFEIEDNAVVIYRIRHRRDVYQQ